MNSLKIFSSLWTRVADLMSNPELPAPDPFDHPAICAMSLRELADLPLSGLPPSGLPLAQVIDTNVDQHGTLPLARCA